MIISVTLGCKLGSFPMKTEFQENPDEDIIYFELERFIIYSAEN